MTAVLLRNTHYPNAAAADAALEPDAATVTRTWWWNLWSRRDFPFHDLTEGTYVALIQSWPGGTRLTWLVQATDVHTSTHPGPDDAIQAIASWTHLSRTEVLEDPYTADRAHDPQRGVLLVWRSAPVRRLDIPRPDTMKLRRTGWGLTTLEELDALAPGQPTPTPRRPTTATPTASPAPRGAGRRLDVEARNAVERHAVKLALQWCTTNGWHDPRHVGEQRLGWDIQGTLAGTDRYLEVKGTTGAYGPVEVTRNEVNKAREHADAYALAIVHGINLGIGPDGTVTANGGTLTIHDPWNPTDEQLQAERYTWPRKH